MKNQKIYLFLSILIILNFCFYLQDASASTLISGEWHKTWGEHLRDQFRAVAIDSSGNIILAGFSEYISDQEHSFSYMRILKCDNAGNQIWSQTWNNSQYDYCTGMVIDSSDNIYLGGSSSRPSGLADICLVKYDSDGNYQWNRTWGGKGIDFGRAIASDSLGNLYIAGGSGEYHESTHLCLMKFDSSGESLWNFTWDGGFESECWAMIIDTSDNIFLGGVYYKGPASMGLDMCYFKINSAGVLQWNNTWGGNQSDFINVIALDSLGNIYLGGHTESFNSRVHDHDMCCIKLNDVGVQQWNITIDSIGQELCSNIFTDSSDNIYFIEFIKYHNLFLLKYNSSGVLLSNYSLEGSYLDYCYATAMDSAENIYLAGEGGKDMVLLKISLRTITFIPGYDLFLLIGVALTVSLVLYKKHYKSLKKII